MNTLDFSFFLLSLISLLIFYFGTGKDRRLILPLSAWALTLGVLAYLRVFEHTTSTPPPMLVLFVVILLVAYLLYKRIDITRINPVVLISIHIFRIPVELMLYELFKAGEIPELMTFAGWNYDIVVGATALLLVLYWLLVRPPSTKLLQLWNVFGLIMLGIIVTLAILSAPLPLQQLAFDQPNTAVLRFPFTLLPGIVVLLVFVAHLLELKRLSKERS